MKKTIAILFIMACSASTFAIEPKTEHTFVLAEGEMPPKATLEDAAWLVGSWVGTAFGNHFEEVWNPPSAGSMVGMFKIYNDEGEIQFYEIMTITIDEGRMSLKVKHFTKDFIAWEEKDDYINFKLVAVNQDALHFAGISFYKRAPDLLEAYMAMRTKDGLKEEKLVFNRVAQ